MAKFYGNIGFVETVETVPGVHMEKAIERPYKGDIVRNSRRWEVSSDSINSNININNSIVIIADDFAIQNSLYIRYVEWMGAYWEVKSMQLDRPRLTLELGGVYEKPIELEEDEEEPIDPEEPEDTTPGDTGDYVGIE